MAVDRDSLLAISILFCGLSLFMNGGRYFTSSSSSDKSDDKRDDMIEVLRESLKVAKLQMEQLTPAVIAGGEPHPTTNSSAVSGHQRPCAVILAKNVTEHRQRHMDEAVYVLKKLGYDVSFTMPEDSQSADLVWAFEYPFLKFEKLRKLKPTQRVNHFVDHGGITFKVDLATMRTGQVPMSFRMPSELDQWKEYLKSEEARGKQWLTKSNGHRGIVLIDNTETFTPAENSFVQHFVGSPLLVDGFKIDFGLYVLVTSAQPLRVYVFEHEAMMRACPESYHPFDPNNTRKYVIDANYKAPWLLPSIGNYFERNSTVKQALLRVLAERGFDGRAMFNEAEDIIRQLFGLVGHKMTTWKGKEQWDDSRLNANGISKHFDLLRVDFIVEVVKQGNNNDNKERLKPWLMEVNFSPNLCASVQPRNQRIFRQIIFDVMSVVGGTLNNKPGFFGEIFNENTFLTVNDIDAYSPSCNSFSSADDCCPENTTCMVCLKKWPESFTNSLKQTLFEQLNRRHFRRIIPPEPVASALPLDAWLTSIGYSSDGSNNRSAADRALATWLYFKCQNERLWCA